MSERPQSAQNDRQEPAREARCKLCGKPLEEELVDPWAAGGPLCFWCAYVEPQG